MKQKKKQEGIVVHSQGINCPVQLFNNYSIEELFHLSQIASKIFKRAQNQIFPSVTMKSTLEEFLSSKTDSENANQTFTESAECCCDYRDDKTQLRNKSIQDNLEFLPREVVNVHSEGLRAKEKAKKLRFGQNFYKGWYHCILYIESSR